MRNLLESRGGHGRRRTTTNRRAAVIAAFVLGCLTLAPPHPAHAQTIPIRVTLLGTGSPIPSMDRFGPATLVEAGGQRLLFDAGRGASQRLWQLKVPLGAIDALFLTHLHSDHTVGIPDIWLTSRLPTPYGQRDAPLEVWGPDGTRDMMSNMHEAYAWDVRIRNEAEGIPVAGSSIVAHDVAEGVIYDRDGVKVTAFLVDHGEALRPALGYRVDHAGHSVVISGDTRPSENLVRHATGTDLLVHEIAAARPELLARSPSAPVARRILGWHTSPEEAARVFSQAQPKLAVLTHIVLLTTDPAFPPPSAEDVMTRLGAAWKGRSVLGEDLMQIEIGDSVVVHRATPR
ncbi:MAG TPA: MBL fold metallo-hydrolase [Gemmatimonadaceae bacterium]|nr:MBL fold metallo-hydrolase [Gemmatimonadaceae bacterium]